MGELENFQMTRCTGCVWTEVDAGELGIAALCWLCAPAASGRRVAGCELCALMMMVMMILNEMMILMI